MAGRWDEVEEHMNAVIPEPGITLDTRLFSENVIVLTLEVSDNLLEAFGE
jgi:hypothetical protein